MSLKRFCDMCSKEIIPEQAQVIEKIDFYKIKAISSWDACKKCAFEIADYISDKFVKEDAK